MRKQNVTASLKLKHHPAMETRFLALLILHTAVEKLCVRVCAVHGGFSWRSQPKLCEPDDCEASGGAYMVLPSFLSLSLSLLSLLAARLLVLITHVISAPYSALLILAYGAWGVARIGAKCANLLKMLQLGKVIKV